jgi:hypothetical protein
MADWSNAKMHWVDPADREAAPFGLAAFVVVVFIALVAGVGLWSLLWAFLSGAITLNLRAAQLRRRDRRRGRT